MSVRSLELSEILAGSPDLEACFLAELRARRERLTQWLRVIEAEVRLQNSAAPARRTKRCRAVGSPRRAKSA
jgi:hypothetical protein